MPTYVYACRACDDRLEVVQKMSDAALTDCVKCGGGLRRVLFPPAVVYKGSGFYVTDYKNGGRKSESSEDKASGGNGAGESKPDAKAETSSETKSESKPEAKTETNAG